ncbi:hypothetical protein FE257_006615 [Aspergillus nanangensis]|uniref:Uncharacterized protein n=1 Tax=Aspergillus nanangensis TaxID=2582783 RepID=A0AAD4CXV3_ASPNN|nr:hypothetical protein FE257_006615 [Aspergillus nanangensis]
MSRRYQIDELLWLRSSPLVAKPTTLPPVEDWMGLTVGAMANRGHCRMSAEDIVLGPPKTAFASASRMASKGSIDSIERPLRQPDADDSKTDRFPFRDRFSKEKENGERDFDRRDGKAGPFNGRRGDREDWTNGRPRRTFGPDDQERKPRRNGEFDRWENRDGTFERGERNKDPRFLPRKDGQPGRARHEGSWFRDDNSQEAPEADEEKTPIRNREWRRDKHGADRDWTRGAKFEQDPEWLDGTEKDEHRRVHTQEDFERWKERMKAGSTQAPAEEKAHISEPAATDTQKSETRPTDGEIFSSSDAFSGQAAMERFFGLLGDAKQPPPQEIITPSPVESHKKEMTPAKAMKSSRFAGLFSPPPGSPAKEFDFHPETKASPVSHAASTDADQEGFQKILLQMLSGSKSRNATPHNDNAQLHRPPSLAHAEQLQSDVSSPIREQFKRSDSMGMPDTPVRNAGPPHGQDPQAREREFLLHLMQQVRVTPGSNHGHVAQGQPQSAGLVPGMPTMPEILSHPPGLASAQKLPNFIEDPAIANMHRPDIEHLRRRPTNGPPLGYFEGMPMPQGGQVPLTPSDTRVPHGQGMHSMGMHRPPGFDLPPPPPGWVPPQLPQQAGGPGSLPPPGIASPSRGGNPNIPPNMMQMHGNMPPLGERQPFPRGAGGGGAPGFPPGMMPPPGFMNAPPPPGFPPMPPSADALMGIDPRSQGPFDGNSGPQGPPPSSRQLLDMFGPGHFR